MMPVKKMASSPPQTARGITEAKTVEKMALSPPQTARGATRVQATKNDENDQTRGGRSDEESISDPTQVAVDRDEIARQL